MKLINLQYIIIFTGLILSVTSFFMIGDYIEKINHNSNETLTFNQNNKKTLNDIQITEITTKEAITTEKIIAKEVITTTKVITTTPKIEKIIFDNLTESELTIKLNKNLSHNLENTGSYFSSYTKITGLDPYLAVAVILQETGCKWKCSSTTINCNNVGGIKGTPSCNGSSYKKYENIEEGINSYLDIIYKNYYLKGLTTPELMNPKYASSNEWAIAVNKYINTIKRS